jgi:hypothetical protein
MYQRVLLSILKNGTAKDAIPFWFMQLKIVLDHNNILCLRAFLTLCDRELYALAFFQVAVTAIISECAEVHENIRAFCSFNETVAFATIEPFDCALYSFRHGLELLSF